MSLRHQISGMDVTAVKELGARLSNWGRWGDDDQLGTVNFLDPSSRTMAAHAVRTGLVFDLGLPLDMHGPQGVGPRFNPIHRMMHLHTDNQSTSGMTWADDMIIMPLQCATQWDGLGHVGYDGFLYNGVPSSTVTADRGAVRGDFAKVASLLIGRGVLLDIPALVGVDRLSPGEPVTADDLTSAEERQGVVVAPGDVLLVRTGWISHFFSGDNDTYMAKDAPGIDVSCCSWLAEKCVAAVAIDTPAFEVSPSGCVDVSLPVHMILIRDLGMTLGEMFNFEILAAECTADGRWDFLFCGAGLSVSGSVGSPLTPLAIR